MEKFAAEAQLSAPGRGRRNAAHARRRQGGCCTGHAFVIFERKTDGTLVSHHRSALSLVKWTPAPPPELTRVMDSGSFVFPTEAGCQIACQDMFSYLAGVYCFELPTAILDAIAKDIVSNASCGHSIPHLGCWLSYSVAPEVYTVTRIVAHGDSQAGVTYQTWAGRDSLDRCLVIEKLHINRNKLDIILVIRCCKLHWRNLKHLKIAFFQRLYGTYLYCMSYTTYRSLR